jgi:Hpt domain
MQSVEDATRTRESGEEGTAWTVEALRSVWERQQDRVGDRIDVIEHAIAALASDRLDTDLRRDAERAAHMLAGSIGMFGFIRASTAARDLELQLAHPTPDRAPALSALLLRVRGGMEGPVVLCSDTAAVEEGVHEGSR